MTLTFIDRLTGHSPRPTAPPVAPDRPGRTATLEQLYCEIESAIAIGEANFACRLAGLVAERFPTDLSTRRLLGRACLEAGDWDRSCAELEFALSLDPEDSATLTMLGVALCSAGRTREAIRAFERSLALDPGDPAARASLDQLSDEDARDSSALSSVPPIAEIRRKIELDDDAAAIADLEEELKRYPGDLYLLILRAELLWQSGRTTRAERVCRQILTRHPRALKPRFILGKILSSEPEREATGVELIESALADDLAGVVAQRIFEGTDFEPPIPAGQLTIDVPGEFDRPASAAAAIDLEPDPEPVEFATNDVVPSVDLFLDAAVASDAEERSSTTAEAPDDVADPEPDVPSPLIAGRPKLIGITVRQRVIGRYGIDGFERLDRRLKAVARELALLGVSLDVAYVDDAASMASFGCSAVSNLSADDVRDAIHALWRQSFDASGATATPRERAVLLIGGDDIVPFFRLPNPADDDDDEILTDTPYGAFDGTSLFLPDVAVGRLPDGNVGNLSLLLRQLDNLVEARREPLIQSDRGGILGAGRLALSAIGLGRSRSAALACVAADRTAIGGLVVSAVAGGGQVHACPPAASAGFDLRWLGDHRCLFFDVSGTTDGTAWFGQAGRPVDGGEWEMPVAFSADNLAGAHLRSPVVFTSAGYAARFGPGPTSGSLALRFLSEGAAALVGSTALTYGASAAPLGGADLLANLFWRHLGEGQPVGEALRLARRSFAEIELDRQGFLDGDDQKTLLEFGAYGDPLFRAFDKRLDEGEPPIPLTVESADFLCKNGPVAAESPAVDRRLVREVVEIVTAQHPELAAGSIRIQRRDGCSGTCGAAAHLGNIDGQTAEIPGVTFVTARTQVTTGIGPDSILTRIARATLDDEGQIVKLVISR